MIGSQTNAKQPESSKVAETPVHLKLSLLVNSEESRKMKESRPAKIKDCDLFGHPHP
jgi:hypothetical protein